MPVIRKALQWRHNERDGVSNHQPHDCLLTRLYKVQIKENIKALRHKGPVTQKMFPFDDVIMGFPSHDLSMINSQKNGIML